MDYDQADAVDMANDEREELRDEVDRLTRENETLKAEARRVIALTTRDRSVLASDMVGLAALVNP